MIALAARLWRSKVVRFGLVGLVNSVIDLAVFAAVIALGAPALQGAVRRVAPQELISTWKQNFPKFWPDGNRFYAPLTGIEPGEVALINARMPGKMTLSTGVMVMYAVVSLAPKVTQPRSWVSLKLMPV